MRRRRVRHERRLGHDEPHVRGVRSGRVQHDGERVRLRRLDDVPHGQLREHRGHKHGRSPVHGVRVWHVHECIEPKRMSSRGKLCSRPRANHGGYLNEPYAMRFVSRRKLLRGRCVRAPELRKRHVGSGSRRKHAMRLVDDVFAGGICRGFRQRDDEPHVRPLRCRHVFHDE
jgi:hypothetical protein